MRQRFSHIQYQYHTIYQRSTSAAPAAEVLFICALRILRKHENSPSPLTRTFVRVTLRVEQKFDKEECVMTGWTFFFILVGVTSLTSQLFRIVDAIERPARKAPLR